MKYKHQQFLTKSKFKMGLDCPSQIFYYNNRDVYADSDVDDDFMKSLAKGGFQVGEYAKAEYPQGHNIEGLSAYEAIERTNELLKQDKVVIFEAALVYNNLFIRADILVKDGNYVKLIEVKAKSLEAHWFDDITDEATFQDYIESKSYEGIVNKPLAFAKDSSKRKLKLNSEWMPYVYDVAFQTYVARNAFPNWYVEAYLCCPDKNAVAEVDGLNQLFMVKDNEKGQTEVKIMGDISPEKLGTSILTTVSVSWIVDNILADKEHTFSEKFADKVNRFAQICLSNEKPEIVISSICKACRFNHDAEKKINGFEECVKSAYKMSDADLKANPSILKIWSFKPNEKLSGVVSELAEKNVAPIFFMKDLSEKDFPRDAENIAPLNQYHRQLLQVQKVKNNDNTEFLAKDLLKAEMEKFTFPLHFIDFETSMVAMPFNKGEQPYKTIAFQFSHHILTKSGKVKHIGQYINLDHENPNVAFVRELKKQLSFDNGTIFRWSNHENSVLLFILRQLETLTDAEVADRQELQEFILTITSQGSRIGERTMVDMWDLYKKFHYMPETQGSNSIKAVLPAVIGRFTSLQSTLSNPVYGKGLEYESLNFEEMSWFQTDENGKVADPYKLLPNIFDKYDRETIDLLFNDDDLKNGGTAMMAYAVCQFKIMTNAEKEKIKAALLRYCELDTFAMVMIYLYWYESCGMEYSEE